MASADAFMMAYYSARLIKVTQFLRSKLFPPTHTHTNTPHPKTILYKTLLMVKEIRHLITVFISFCRKLLRLISYITI